MRNRIKIFSILLVSLFVYQSCGISDVIVIDPTAKYSSTEQDEVKLYLTPSDLPASYEKLGIVFTGAALPSGQIKKARKRAARMGANGLYWENYSNQINNNGLSMMGDTLILNGANNNGGFVLVAIRTE